MRVWLRLLLSSSVLSLGCTCGTPKVVETVPLLSIDVEVLDFGAVPEGTTSNRTLVLGNSGRAVLEVTASVVDGSSPDFALTTRQLSVEPGTEQLLAVAFSPKGRGIDNGWVLLQTNERPAREVVVELRGGPIAPRLRVSPDPVEFTGSTAWVERRDVTLENVGTAELKITDLGVEAVGNPDFSVPSLSRETALLPAERTVVRVTYSRTTKSEPGALVILSTDSDSPMTRVPLLAAPVGRCGNGLDDDRDGKTDYPDDPGCEGVNDDDETDPAPCLDGAQLRCGTDVGECRAGQRTCANGVFGACVGAIEPLTEVCDQKDNNCNGAIDEGLVGCGGLDGGAGGGTAGGVAGGGGTSGGSAGGTSGGSSGGTSGGRAGGSGGGMAGGSAGGAATACPSTGGHWIPLASTLRHSHLATWADDRVFVAGGSDGAGLPARAASYDATTFARTDAIDGGVALPNSFNCKVAFVRSVRQVVTLCPTAAQSQRYALDTQTWLPVTATNFVGLASEDFVVSTGSQLFLWDTSAARGVLYDPATDAFAPVSTTGAPVAPCCGGVTWSGSKVVLWGGTGSTALLASNLGFTFDPLANAWATLPTTGAPTPRGNALIAANSSELIVWGGSAPAGSTANGARLAFATGQWAPLSAVGAPTIATTQGAFTASSALVGAKFVVVKQSNQGGTGINSALGFSYDLSTGTWAELSSIGAPVYRQRFSITFTPDGLFVIGGYPVGVGPSSMMRGHVSRWSAATNTWSNDALLEPPVIIDHSGSSGGNATMVWAASVGQAIVFNAANGVGSGGRFNVATRTWQPISLVNAPLGTYHASSVWSGTRMLTFGLAGSAPGASYDPVTDTWARWPASAAAPSSRYEPIAQWTGSRLFVFGTNGSNVNLDSNGGRFEPATQTWVSTNLFGAPSPRYSLYASSVVVGPERVAIWGGSDLSSALGDGAIYDAAADVWTPIPAMGAPSPRLRHAAVWTGTEMLIWGGTGAGKTGAAFNPTTNRWRPMNAVNSPVEGDFPAGVWTGSRALFLSESGRGGLYDPATDSWSCLPTENAPSFRRPLAQWTPSGLVVFGYARNGGGPTNVGAIFVP